MVTRLPLPPIARRFWRDETGAQLVEFAFALPLLLLLFAVTIEGGRMLWAYQSVASGVRDATRYLARVTPRDICERGTGVAGYTDRLEGIVRNAQTGEALFPNGIQVTEVLPSLACNPGDYRGTNAPIVTVNAVLQITFPFSGIFEFVGGSRPTLNTALSDQSRVYGS
jgi:Flp pilus assembly pilin Flp